MSTKTEKAYRDAQDASKSLKEELARAGNRERTARMDHYIDVLKERGIKIGETLLHARTQYSWNSREFEGTRVGVPYLYLITDVNMNGLVVRRAKKDGTPSAASNGLYGDMSPDRFVKQEEAAFKLIEGE